MSKAIVNNWQQDQRTGIQQDTDAALDYGSAVKALYTYAKPHRWSFVVLLFFILLSISADLLQPYLVKIAIDDVLTADHADFRSLLLLCGIYFLLAVAGFVFTYLQNNLLQRIGQSIVAGIRSGMFKHLVKLSVSYFDRVSTGSLIAHVSSDTEGLNRFFNQVLASLLRDGLTLIFIVVLMFRLDVRLTLFSLLIIPVITLIAYSFRAYMRATYQLVRTALSRMIAFAAENLSGMNLIQVFHQEKEQQRQFTERNDAFYRTNLREIRTMVVFNRIFDILGNLSVAFVVWLGGRAVLGEQIEFGVLYAFITYIRQFFQPINSITQQWNTVQSTIVSVNRIWSVFKAAPDVRDPEEATPVKRASIAGKVEFEGVTFGYKEGRQVLHKVDLNIQPGEMLGIVGATGAGKSSLISLLCRFYDVKEGSIRIDGFDIRKLKQKKLQRIVGLVQQEPFLYSGSVLDNIRLFDESIPEETVIRACERVGVDQLVRRMKDGYATRLTENGTGFSSGEKQLISFARIIVFQPKILILDEATANLDSHTEQLLQSALRVVSEGRTTLVIAHRLSTIRRSDRIIVLDQGQIVEEGNHDGLMEQKGYYSRLYLNARGVLV
ncbi:ABC transporter ATP-binding protein [Paenibacillus sp. BC26]|uniref:ABC transporter ATP-binding protein n=1 Tax=Paenibacillus sp. BC26 TaxID=1881032 RepID=UPI0008EB13FF|nr:ABC transporter ATP-binding protein [Paenibacillus sp. BC26]SFT05176.1 ATP-binding cassette, subfamily B [Paenibacillus sp. BC26]